MAHAKLKPILGSDRVIPPCLVADRCGGCQIQDWRYGAQLTQKTQQLRQILKDALKLTAPPVRDIMGMQDPWGFRYKAQLPLGVRRGQVQMGFFESGTHHIVDTHRCLVQPEKVDKTLGLVRQFLETQQILIYDEKRHCGLARHVLVRMGQASGEILVCLVINGSHLPAAEHLVALLRTEPRVRGVLLNINTRPGTAILGSVIKTLWGASHIEDQMDGLRFRISAKSFFQVNPLQGRVLYRQALELAAPRAQDVVWDLYCGTGTLALYFARCVRYVQGLDNVSEAIADAKQNARLNKISNVSFQAGKAEQLLPRWRHEMKQTPDIVILDPPRKGCTELVLRELLTLRPMTVIYVSCDPVTLARDLAILCRETYHLETVQPVDMFPHTAHIECVALLKRV